MKTLLKSGWNLLERGINNLSEITGMAGGLSVLAASLMAASAFWPHALLAQLSFFLFGAGPIVWTVSTTTLRQTVTPGERLGRVGALFLTANAGARPLGAALGAGIGAVATAMLPGGDERATTACLVVAAMGFVVQFVAVLLSALPGLRTLPARPATGP